MSHDIETLKRWIQWALVIAAFTTTLVPLVYARTPWTERLLGRLFMLQAVSFAFAIDFTLLMWFWPIHNVLVLFWVNALVFTLISISTSALAWKIWYLNYPHRKGTKNVAREPGIDIDGNVE